MDEHMEALKSKKNDELDTDLHGKHLPAFLWRFLHEVQVFMW